MEIKEIKHHIELPKDTVMKWFGPPYCREMFEESIDIFKKKIGREPTIIYQLDKQLFMPVEV